MKRSGFVFFHNRNNFRQPAQTKQQTSSKKDISYRAALSGSPPQPPCSCHLSPTSLCSPADWGRLWSWAIIWFWPSDPATADQVLSLDYLEREGRDEDTPGPQDPRWRPGHSLVTVSCFKGVYFVLRWIGKDAFWVHGIFLQQYIAWPLGTIGALPYCQSVRDVVLIAHPWDTPTHQRCEMGSAHTKRLGL